MLTVGSSISSGGKAASSPSSGAARVSPMATSSGPASHTMSPAATSSTSLFSRPRVTHRWVMRAASRPATSKDTSPPPVAEAKAAAAAAVLTTPSPSVLRVMRRATSSPTRRRPCSTRPQPMRPM